METGEREDELNGAKMIVMFDRRSYKTRKNGIA